MNPDASSILIFGREGQVTRALQAQSQNSKFVGRDECDFLRLATIVDTLNFHRPRIVINPAAYTDVDRAEGENETATLVNTRAPRIIAEWCKTNHATLIHYSTDYVYGGDGQEAFREQDPVTPSNVYAQTKLEGERAIQASGCQHIILRTSWIFDQRGKNFVRTILKLAAQRDELRVVDDQWGSPTYAPDLAQATMRIVKHINQHAPFEIYNFANAGMVTWFGFANEILRRWAALGNTVRAQRILPIASKDFPTAAQRPLNSRLNTAKIQAALNFKIRSWSSALDDCLARVAPQSLK